MNKIGKNDVRSLIEKAERSEDNEAFKVVAKIGDCRIGIGARLEPHKDPTYFVEVLIRLCNGQDTVDLDLVERKLSLLRRLRHRGYALSCGEDGCVSCELVVELKKVSAECKVASTMIKKCMKTENWQLPVT